MKLLVVLLGWACCCSASLLDQICSNFQADLINRNLGPLLDELEFDQPFDAENAKLILEVLVQRSDYNFYYLGKEFYDQSLETQKIIRLVFIF